jgi:hypothetical protein
MLVPRNDAWTAMAHSKYVEEISSAPDDVLSSLDAAVEVCARIFCVLTFADFVYSGHTNAMDAWPQILE